MVKALMLFLKIYTYSRFDFLLFRMLFTKKNFKTKNLTLSRKEKFKKLNASQWQNEKKIELTQKGDVGDKQGGKKRMIRKI